MIGVPGSGKSTISKLITLGKENWVTVSADNYPGYYIDGEYTWSPTSCNLAHKYCREIFKDAVSKQINIVLDNTNITIKSRRFYIEFATTNGYDYTLLTILPEKEKIKTYAERGLHRVGLNKIHQMAKLIKSDIANNI